MRPMPAQPFSQVIDALLDNTQPFLPQYLHRFSDMFPEDVQALQAVWLQIDPQRRINLLEDLEELMETDTVVLFDEISLLAMKDPQPRARAAAIRLQSEEPKPGMARIFIKMAETDPEETVRAAAASALGQYIYLGELDDVRPEIKEEVENHLLKIIGGKDASLVRRRALESMGYSSRDEVPPLIKKAYLSKDTGWIASALFAMGRSMDLRWEKQVMNNLESPDPEISFEAVRAAGKMEIQAARPRLLRMLENYDELELDVRGAVIWSLSEIGGEGVKKTLRIPG